MLTQGFANRITTRYRVSISATNAKGGCSEYRTVELSNRVHRQLAEMYPDYVALKTKVLANGPWKGEERVTCFIQWAKAYKDAIKAKYANLLEMYNRISDDDPYETAMMIYPAVHYTMGGVWVDYNLMTSIPGCYAIGEANFSDHGANRLGASALMQGLADGYFVLPYTIGDYLSDDIRTGPINTQTPEFEKAESTVKSQLEAFVSNSGSHSVDYYHRKLGKIMWNKCGMSRNKNQLKEAINEIKNLREDFHQNVKIPGELNEFNEELSKATRVSDFLELGELFAKDALEREESCGGHFREESQTESGEALRVDDKFSYVSAWEFQNNQFPKLHKEKLEFENVKLAERSYK